MLSVGVLAALINICVLVVVSFVDRGVEVIVRNFAAARLRATHTVPIIHDSDTWVLNMPFSLFKYRRYPAIFFTIFLSLFLLISEVITEIGVAVSQTCGPVLQNGTVILPGDVTGQASVVGKGAAAFLLQNLTFMDGAITSIPSGLPKSIKGDECISCMNKHSDKYPAIVRNCSVNVKRTYRPKELQIGVKRDSTSVFGIIAVGFREVFGSTLYTGLGDVSVQGKFAGAFVVDASEVINGASYLEYSNQEHIKSLFLQAQSQKDISIWDFTQSDVELLTIRCGINAISAKNFEDALQTYRTIALENHIFPLPFDRSTARFPRLTSQDVYKAVLAVKLSDVQQKEDAYFTYVTCGVYKVMYILPMMFSLLILILLAILSFTCSEREMRRIPFSSKTWFLYTKNTTFEENKAKQNILSRESRMSRLKALANVRHDEMIVLEMDSAGEEEEPRIVIKYGNHRTKESFLR